MRVLRHLGPITVSIMLTLGSPFFASAEGLAARCESIFTDTRSFENLTKYEQLFTKGRGIETYKVVLGRDFSNSLQRLLVSQDGHWFDSGAGHAFAVRQTLEMPEAANLKTTVVAYETSARSTNKMKVISGRFLENIADAEISKSHLITDVFGPLAYSGRPDIVMQKYLNNLKPDGEIYIFLGARHELYGEFNKVVTADGRVLNLAEWLQTLPGTKAELIKTPKVDDGTHYDMWTIKITKTQPDAQVPLVEMVHLKEGAPPVMMFRETAPVKLKAPNELQAQARTQLREVTKNITATEFLDAFRGGEFRHPLIASIKSLKAEDQWINSSEVGPQVFSGLQKKDYNYEDTKVFTGMAQKFIRWRSNGINTEKMHYTLMSDTYAMANLKDVKLITDYHGDFMSSFMPDVILNRYVDAISNKGEIYIYLGKEYGGFGSDSVVMTKEGTKLPLRQWIRNIPGLKTSFFRGGYHWTGGEWTFLKIKIKDREKIQIPRLKMIGTTTSPEGLPLPIFEEAI